MSKLRVFTAFSGYDSQCLALNRLRETHGVDYELVGWSEIDKDAIKAHNALFPDAVHRNYGDISKIDWSTVPDFDLFTYSSPCQDFSTAGLQRGGEEGSGTRSSLLWECRRAIVAKRPLFLLLENVKALTSDKFLPLLQKWCAELSIYGYVNHCAVLNAKDYGVPQNRERVFVFSIRKDVTGAADYRFPRPFPLKRKLRNILEEDVDEKYYLKDETVERFLRKTAENKEKGLGFQFSPPNPDGVSYTLKCQGYESVADPRFIDLLGYSRSNKGKGEVINYHPIETANTPTTSSGSGGNTDQSVRVGGIRTRPTGGGKKLRLELHPDPDTTGTITTVEKFNNLLVTNEDGSAPTLTAMMGTGGNNEPLMLLSKPRYRIRKLTERECFRLMGVEDADIDTIQASGVSRSAQYKMAGNSIVVDVLYHIFRQAFTSDRDTSGAVVETIKVDVQQLKLF